VLASLRERDDASRRNAVVAAANALDRRWKRRYVDVDDYLDERGRPAFERDVEETPARHAFERARRTLESAREEADRHRRRGQYAGAAMRAGTAVAATGAFVAVVDGIRDGKFGPPPDAKALTERWAAAVDALEGAWDHEPTALSVGLADTARGHLRSAGWLLDSDGTGEDVDRAVGTVVYAERYADRVPTAVDATVDALDGG